MQSVTEAWTHGADPTFCLLSKDQLRSLREEGVNKVMKEMINKYLVPTSNAGIKKIIVKPDEHYFDKIVRFKMNLHTDRSGERNYKEATRPI